MIDVEELVHIIPLGYEVDRAVAPFQHMKAHRAYLLSIIDSVKYDREMNRKQRHYERRVKEALEAKGVQVEIRNIDMFSILDVMKHVSSLIVKEKARKNRVYVNMSACGKITSVGATLAAMAHNVRIYYVRADGYSRNDKERMDHGLSICREGRLWGLENFRIHLPDPVSLKILVSLFSTEKGLSAENLLQMFIEEKVPGFEADYRTLKVVERRRLQSNYLMKLNKGYLTKLEQSGYITRKKVGRNTVVNITDSGKYCACISGMME